jgi:hypothetical protein
MTSIHAWNFKRQGNRDDCESEPFWFLEKVIDDKIIARLLHLIRQGVQRNQTLKKDDKHKGKRQIKTE